MTTRVSDVAEVMTMHRAALARVAREILRATARFSPQCRKPHGSGAFFTSVVLPMRLRHAGAPLFLPRDRCARERVWMIRRKRNFFSQDALESTHEDAFVIESARISARVIRSSCVARASARASPASCAACDPAIRAPRHSQ